MPLGKKADAGDYIKDFEKSDAPQFKGKSKEKRRKMAIAAYLDSKEKKESKMKSLRDIREAANAAQQAAIAIAKKEKGEKPKNEGKKMDSAAMKRAMDAFKKKGGKIKKVAPGKAAGYHGKDDPGQDVQGMMDRGDTKGMPRKKKVRSMR